MAARVVGFARVIGLCVSISLRVGDSHQNICILLSLLRIVHLCTIGAEEALVRIASKYIERYRMTKKQW